MIVLNGYCANPACYRKAKVKRHTLAGGLEVEVGLCASCATRAGLPMTAHEKIEVDTSVVTTNEERE